MTIVEHFAKVTETVLERAERDLEVLRQYAESKKPVRGLLGLFQHIGETVGRLDDANS